MLHTICALGTGVQTCALPIFNFLRQSQRSAMRFLLLMSAALALSACSIIYKLPTRQGNVIEQKQLDQLKLGMTHEQVHYLIGTPIAASAFRPNCWAYVGYYKSPRGEVKEIGRAHV